MDSQYARTFKLDIVLNSKIFISSAARESYFIILHITSGIFKENGRRDRERNARDGRHIDGPETGRGC